jgi:hypothetical protein
MNFDTERKLIETAFQQGMAPDKAIQWENNPFPEPPKTGWVRLSVLGGQSFLAGIAGAESLQRFPGVIDVAIFVPRNGGKAALCQKADAISAILAHKSFASGSTRILTFGARLDVIGESGDWFQGNLTFPFQRDN